VGILTEKEIQSIKDRIRDPYTGINFIPIMKKEADIAWFDRLEGIVFFLRNDNFSQCFRRLSKDAFKASVKELESDGWSFI